MRRLVILALVGIAGALALECADLTPLQPNVCGDGVINTGEDCDGFASADGGVHEACGAADAGTQACRFVCAGTAECPNGYNCGLDLICRKPTGAFTPLGSPLAVGATGVVLADFNGDGYDDALTHGPVNNVGGVHLEVDYLKSDGTLLGTFALADRVASPSVADVNGDGIPDVVGALRIGSTSGVSVFLGQKSNALAIQPFATATIPAAALPSATASVRAFGFVGFESGPRTAYFMGTAGGAYTPGLYLPSGSGLPAIAAPGETRILPLPEGPDQVVGNVVLAQIYTGPPALTYPCPAMIYETLGGTVRVLTPCVQNSGVTEFAGKAIVASVTLPSTSLSACFDASNDDCGPGVMVADLNGDGFPDLIVNGTAANPSPGSSYATYVAYGDGAGDFGSAPLGSDFRTVGVTSGPLAVNLRSEDGAVVTEPVQLGPTLAAGDVNGDGYADLVSRVAVYATAIGQPLAVADALLVSDLTQMSEGDAGPNGGFDAGEGPVTVEYNVAFGSLDWKTSAMGDFNGDGMVDVVGSASTAGIDFYTPSPVVTGVYTGLHSIIATAGGTDTFAVGDFDGDGISDLAFQQLDPADDGTADVVIAYGNANGAPGPAMTIGHYAAVVQISASPPYTEMQVVAAPLGAAGTLTVTQFATAAGGRPPLSSEGLASAQADAGSPPDLAFAAVAGSFASAVDGGVLPDGAVVPSVAALGSNEDTMSDYLWFLPGLTPTAGAGVAFASPAVAASPPASNFSPSLLSSATTNQALLMAAAPLGAGGPASLVALAALSNPAQAALLIAAPSGTTPTLAPTNASNGSLPVLSASLPDGGTVSPSIAEDGQLALRDLDGDGYADLVVLTGTGVGSFCSASDGTASPAPSTARLLLVFWNDTHGGFQLSSPVVVASCSAAESCGATTTDCPEAFTTLTINGSALPTLAFVTHSSVEFAQFSNAGGQTRQLLPITSPVLASVSSTDGGRPADATIAADAGSPLPAGLVGYDGISGGDINGDGIDDFAVTAQGSLYLFVGTPSIR